MKTLCFSLATRTRFLTIIAGLWLCGVVGVPLAAFAQQPTAAITSMTGSVLVSLQGQSPAPAQIGMELGLGDVLETHAESNVVLRLSEGSELHLGQNTRLDLAALFQNPKTQARTSRIKLLYGRLRAFLSPGHQADGSAFTVETPNAVIGVKFSHPDIEVMYDPETDITVVIAYTVSVRVTNLLTKETKVMPKTHQAIVQGEFLWIAPITPGLKEIPPAEQRRLTRLNLFFQAEQIWGGTVSAVPSSAGTRSETSQSPGPGGGSTGPRPQTVIINTSEE